MEIKINIDESKFQEVLEKELAAFSQEELHEIMKGAIKEYLNKENVIKEIINKPETDRWGCSKSGTTVIDKFVNNVDLSDIFVEPKEKIKEIISNDANLKAAAIDILVGVFKNRFREAILGDYNFIDQICMEVSNRLNQFKYNNQ